MIPRTLSASSISVAENCLARFAAENINFAGRQTNDPALLGSTVHSALENYVQWVHIDKTKPEEKKLLLDLYRMHAISNFGSADFEMYEEGFEMLNGWWDRTVGIIQSRTVLSTEEKLNFPLNTSIGVIPFTYIMDRLDQINDNEYEITDYKTIRWGFNPEDLKKKMQARIYALALSVLLKSRGVDNRNVKIWVCFDLLRHSSVAVPFTHEENMATYRKLQEIAERIIQTDEKTAPATLNSDCQYCTIKATCPQLISNINAGGAFGLTTAELTDRRAQLEYQRKAVVAGISEIDEIVIAKAKEEDVLNFWSVTNKMSITISSRKGVDADMVERAVGPELFELYGGKSLTMVQFNKLLKDTALNATQVKVLKSLVQLKQGDPRVKTEPRGFIEDE